MVQSSYSRPVRTGQSQTGLRRLAPIAAGAVVLILVVFLVANAVGSCSGGGPAKGKARFAASMEPDVAYSLEASGILSIPDAPAVTALSLGDGDAGFSVGSRLLDGVEGAVGAIRQLGPCGFVLVDVSSGRALSLNAGQAMYVASASKMPLAMYALTHPEDGEGVGGEDRENIEWAILYSDNDAYFELCRTYFDDGYMEWLGRYGIETPLGRDDYFPAMSARSLAAVWADFFLWLQSGDEDAQWLAELLGTTEESYLREALAGDGAVVLDKAGWMGDDDARSVTDAGIVQLGGRTYVVALVTEQPEWDDAARLNVERLASALFDVRGVLAPHLVLTVQP